jgi:transcriptional regulator of aromatic amino acid metabolism
MTNRAFERVDALLRAYGFSHSAVRSRYCLEILTEAQQALITNGEALETLAARITLNRIQTGVGKIMIAAGFAVESIDMEDFYLALQAAGIPKDAPEIILEGKQPKDKAVLEQIRRNYESQAKPTLRRTSMGASSLRFDTIDEVTGSTERFLQQHPALTRLLKASLIFTTFYLVYIFAK